MSVETVAQLAFAASILIALGALAAAALERAGRRILITLAGLLSAAAATAWVVFAFDPTKDLAVAATGLTVTALVAWAAVLLRRALARAHLVDESLNAAKARLDELVGQEAALRAEELEHTLARARADSVSALLHEERQIAEERRKAFAEQERTAGAELAEKLLTVQRRVEQRFADWAGDLQRIQENLAADVARLSERQGELIAAAEARAVAEGERLESLRDEQREEIRRFRAQLIETAEKATSAAQAELEAHSVERRRALQEVSERLRVREKQLDDRITHEEAESARRVQTTFAEIERRQIEQLKRIIERSGVRVSDAAALRFEEVTKTAREEAAKRLSRELERSVQMFAHEAQSVLAERLAQVGDRGAERLEGRLAQISAALERQRDELANALQERLAEAERDFVSRLQAVTADGEAARAVLEARLVELSRRLKDALDQAERRSLQVTRD